MHRKVWSVIIDIYWEYWDILRVSLVYSATYLNFYFVCSMQVFPNIIN